jgi:long-chain acyl-CoA synthetase
MFGYQSPSSGRAKDTIVLSNGENVEPQPLEDAILGGSGGLVELVMLTGQTEDDWWPFWY